MFSCMFSGTSGMILPREEQVSERAISEHWEVRRTAEVLER
jgi:hypothetical protein